jgi:hypothetical protein
MTTKHCEYCNCDHAATSEFWRIRGNYFQCKAKLYSQQLSWRSKHAEQWKELLRRHYRKHREKIIKLNTEYSVRRRKVDVNYNLTIILRQRFNKALKQGYKAGSAVADLGCSVAEFRKHVESQWSSGMSWENYGRNGWHIDHIIPISKFNLSDREQVKQACHYTNLQPLWARDNIVKGNK